MAKSAESTPASDRRTDEAFDKMSAADDGKAAIKTSADGDEGFAQASTAHAPDSSDEKKPSAFDNMVKKAQPYLDKHGHAICYGIVGIVAAVLILTIGFWPVLLLAIFAAIGIAIGKFRDSGASVQNAARSLVGSIRR